MPGKSEAQLSRRERQIMDIIYARGQASAAEVHQAMADRPSYSAVRALLRILEDKGHLRHTTADGKYIYVPRRSRQQAAQAALRRLVKTFFDGSAEMAVAALLQSSDTRPDPDELERLATMIEQARKGGR
jgi:predicted transcriptional regulator